MAFLTQIAEITDYLYLCSATAITRQRLSILGITHIINCTLDVPNLNVPGIQSTQIHVDDHSQAQLYLHFDRVADEISTIASRGGKVIVHCVAGVSRSATLCIVHLMKYHRMTLAKAHDFVQKRRSVIRPNNGFWKQMIEYERKLYGRNSVHLVNSNVGLVPNLYTDKARHSVSVPSTSYSRAYGRAFNRRPRYSY